jgi:hypothetical protein
MIAIVAEESSGVAGARDGVVAKGLVRSGVGDRRMRSREPT